MVATTLQPMTSPDDVTEDRGLKELFTAYDAARSEIEELITTQAIPEALGREALSQIG